MNDVEAMQRLTTLLRPAGPLSGRHICFFLEGARA